MKPRKNITQRSASGRAQNAQAHTARREQQLASVWSTLLEPPRSAGHSGTGQMVPTTLHADTSPAVRWANTRNQPSDRRRQSQPSKVSQAQASQSRASQGKPDPLVSSAQTHSAPIHPAQNTQPKGLHLSVLPVLMALMLAGTFGSAAAQDISTSLPLTSVGDRLMWSVGDQTLTLKVPVSGQIRLDLYSPQLDPADYRADSYYGDETYDAQPVGTIFELVDGSGKVVAARAYAPGTQTWDTLFDQTLEAGSYRLRASTSGNGKNTFAVRLMGASASVSADRLAVNVHSQAFVPVLSVTTDGPGYALQMYDGDGATELEAQLRDASGKVYPLMVSGQRGNVSLPLPDAAGRYTVLLRQPAGAKQYSNTVGFSLVRGAADQPITLSSSDTLGLLRVEAELLLPGGNVPTSIPVQIGDEAVKSEPYQAQRPAGTYPVSAPAVPGAEVRFPEQVTVKKGETALVRVQVKPNVTLTLSTDRPQVCVGDVVRFTARVTTAYAGELPLDLSLVSDGLTFSGRNNQTGTLSSRRPAELSLEATAIRAGNFSVMAKLSPWADMKAVSVTVLPDATSLQLRRAEVAAANPSETVTVSLSPTNTSREVQPYALSDTPGAGLDALGSV